MFDMFEVKQVTNVDGTKWVERERISREVEKPDQGGV